MTRPAARTAQSRHCRTLKSTRNLYDPSWLRHRTYYCAFLLERREPHGVPRPCGHRCVCVCATVCHCFSDNQRFNYDIGHSFKTDIRRISFFYGAPYGDDVIGRELNLDENCPIGSTVGRRIHNLPNSCD